MKVSKYAVDLTLIKLIGLRKVLVTATELTLKLSILFLLALWDLKPEY